MNKVSISDKIKREVKYTNRDFGDLRNSLINYAKNYFPNTYNDFNESSPGMIARVCAADAATSTVPLVGVGIVIPLPPVAKDKTATGSSGKDRI